MNTQTLLSTIVLSSLFAVLSISTAANAEHEHQARLLDDKQAPTVLYHPSTSTDGKEPFTVTVKDDEGIQSVTLIYRKLNSSQYMTTRMKRVGKSNSYITDLGKHDLGNNLDFNILAVDLAGNSQLVRGNSGQAVASAGSKH